MTIDPYIILGAAIVGFLVGMTGAGGGALMTPMLILLFGVAPSDPVSYAAVSTLLVAAVLAASLIPARRATGVSPVEALRSE